MGMIHKYKVIFIRIPKTASTSIYSCFKNKTDKKCSHETYKYNLCINDFDLFFDYFSFSCVRNPYDRFVSIYKIDEKINQIRKIRNEVYTFDNLIFKLYNKKLNIDDLGVMYKEQHKYICINDTILVDKLLKYENLNEDWLDFSNIINNLPNNKYKISTQLPMENVNHNKPYDDWKDYYTDETKNMIYEIYKKDFEIFGYEK